MSDTANTHFPDLQKLRVMTATTMWGQKGEHPWLSNMLTLKSQIYLKFFWFKKGRKKKHLTKDCLKNISFTVKYLNDISGGKVQHDAQTLLCIWETYPLHLKRNGKKIFFFKSDFVKSRQTLLQIALNICKN